MPESVCVVDKSQARYIYGISYLSALSALYALYRKYYALAVVPGGVFLTSVLFWRDPRRDCWARYADVLYVQFAFFFQLYRARNAQYLKAYLAAMALALCSFGGGVYLTWRWDILNLVDAAERSRKMWAVTLLHSGVHVFGNLGNMVLYSGTV